MDSVYSFLSLPPVIVWLESALSLFFVCGAGMGIIGMIEAFQPLDDVEAFMCHSNVHISQLKTERVFEANSFFIMEFYFNVFHLQDSLSRA